MAHSPLVKNQVVALKTIAESCSRQLRAWADCLQNSNIKGQRHLNDRTRQQTEQQKRAIALQKKLLLNLPATHPLRKDAEERGEI